MVERQPSKLNVDGSSPFTRSSKASPHHSCGDVFLSIDSAPSRGIGIQVDIEIECLVPFGFSTPGKEETGLFEEMNGGIPLDADIENDLHVVPAATELHGMIKKLLPDALPSKVVVDSQSANLGDIILDTLDTDHSDDFLGRFRHPETTSTLIAEIAIQQVVDIGPGVVDSNITFENSSTKKRLQCWYVLAAGSSDADGLGHARIHRRLIRSRFSISNAGMYSEEHRMGGLSPQPRLLLHSE